MRLHGAAPPRGMKIDSVIAGQAVSRLRDRAPGRGRHSGVPEALDFPLPESLHDDLSGAAPAVAEYARTLDTVFGPVADEAHWYDGLHFSLNALRDVVRSVELVLDALEASGQADRTVVVFTADHGEMAGSHGLRQKCKLVCDESFHVPFILPARRHRPPGHGGGHRRTVARADRAPRLQGRTRPRGAWRHCSRSSRRS
ncbi:sulfatase-like hydrolase/transferase [Streptomyces sp. NPDC059556]|uniref:sulfatase-like hydrolase/transferase n=1 Tax=Streptomyces sp. NPDC059556 TaxID=3346863 RepID=UPI00369FE556